EHCRDRVPAGSLSPNSQSTLSPCEVRQRSLPTLRCLGPPLSALHLAIHQELREARQCFLACISYKDSLTAMLETATNHTMVTATRRTPGQFAAPRRRGSLGRRGYEHDTVKTES